MVCLLCQTGEGGNLASLMALVGLDVGKGWFSQVGASLPSLCLLGVLLSHHP